MNGEKGFLIKPEHKLTARIAFTDDVAEIAAAINFLTDASTEHEWGFKPYLTTQTCQEVYYACDVQNALVHILSQIDSKWLDHLEGEQLIHLLLHIDGVGKPDITFLSLVGFDVEGRLIFKGGKGVSTCFPVSVADCKDTMSVNYVQRLYEQIAEGIHKVIFKMANCKATFKFSNVLFEVGDRAVLKLFTGVLNHIFQ